MHITHWIKGCSLYSTLQMMTNIRCLILQGLMLMKLKTGLAGPWTETDQAFQRPKIDRGFQPKTQRNATPTSKLETEKMSRAATRFFLTTSLLPLPLATKWRRGRPSIRATRAFAMAASGFDGGEEFRLSDDPGAGVLKLLKGDITQWSVDGATDAIVRSVASFLFIFAIIRAMFCWLLLPFAKIDRRM